MDYLQFLTLKEKRILSEIINNLWHFIPYQHFSSRWICLIHLPNFIALTVKEEKSAEEVLIIQEAEDKNWLS